MVAAAGGAEKAVKHYTVSAQTWASIFSLIHTEMSWPEGAGGCH